MAQFEQDVMLIPPRDEDSNGVFSAPSGYVVSNGKMVPRYPRGDLSTGWPILSALGSYWARQFTEKGKLLKLYRASSVLAMQTYVNWLETLAATSRYECPIFHRRVWYALTLRESDMTVGESSMLKYDGTALYDGAYRYGVPLTHEFQAVDLDEIKNIGVLLNRFIDPTLAWVNGTDFFISEDDGALLLRDNPFNDPRLTIKNILDSDGEVADREVTFWAFNTLEDWEYIYSHYGYALRYRASESSDSYKGLVNAMWNGFAGGLSTQDFEWAIAAIAGLPSVKETSETVEVLLNYPGRKVVIVTDQHAYTYPAGSIAKVAVNDTVYAGQVLVDTILVFDLANFDDIISLIQTIRIDDAGEIVTRYTPGRYSSSSARATALREYLAHRSPSKLRPPDDELPLMHVLPVPKDMLVGDYQGSLGFLNAERAYDESSTDANGNVIGKITGVVGSEDDIALLWNTAHAAGLAEAELWMEKIGRPLPAYVNPAGFAIEHFLRNNAVVVYLRYTRFGDAALGLGLLTLLRKTLPPDKAVIYLVEVDVSDLELSDDAAPCFQDFDGESSSSGLCAEVDWITADYAGREDVFEETEAWADMGSSSSSAWTALPSGLASEAVEFFYPSICG